MTKFSWIPNALSFIRLILSFLLPFTWSDPYFVFVICCLCGLTDILDGYLARKFNWTSEFGSHLDSLSDFVFYIFLILYFIINHCHLFLEYLIPLGMVFIIRISTLIICCIKNHKIYFLHTIGNKVTGVVIFCAILLYIITLREITFLILFTISLVSAIEELMIMIIIKNPDPNTKSIFKVLNRGNA